MRHRRLIALFAAMLAIGAGVSIAGPAVGAELRFPPGLRIGLELPAGLTPSARFPGFEDADRKVAVTVLDLPAVAYEEIERSIFAKDQPGMTNMKRESFPFASGIGFLATGQIHDGGTTLHKWFLLALPQTVKDLTLLINVEVPEAALSVYSDAVIRKALASVAFRPTPTEEQLAMLPFKLNEMAGFRVMQAIPTGGVILTEGPSDDISQQPYMIVSVGAGAPADADQRGKFSRELLSSAPLRDISVTLGESMRIGGLQGYEVRAQAKSLTGAPVNLVQWMKFGSSGFLRVIGVGANNDWDKLFTRFRAVRDGIESR
jgi:hypothetical protein